MKFDQYTHPIATAGGIYSFNFSNYSEFIDNFLIKGFKSYEGFITFFRYRCVSERIGIGIRTGYDFRPIGFVSDATDEFKEHLVDCHNIFIDGV